MDDFFYYVSKLVIVIPIFLIISGIFLKFSQLNKKTSIKIIPTPKNIFISPTPIRRELNLDLKGPFVCEFSNNQSTISAFIKDKKIFVRKINYSEVDNFLLNNDCVYFWKEGKFTGEKYCGVSSYLSILETFPSLLFNFKNLGFEEFQFSEIKDFCQKKQIDNEKIFEIPVKILFKNTNLLEILK